MWSPGIKLAQKWAVHVILVDSTEISYRVLPQSRHQTLQLSGSALQNDLTFLGEQSDSTMHSLLRKKSPGIYQKSASFYHAVSYARKWLLYRASSGNLWWWPHQQLVKVNPTSPVCNWSNPTGKKHKCLCARPWWALLSQTKVAVGVKSTCSELRKTTGVSGHSGLALQFS